MTDEVVQPGEKLHVMEQRLVESQPRRHFAGVVEAVSAELVRLVGYPFVLDPSSNSYVRKQKPRTRILSLLGGHVVNVLPADADIEAVSYRERDDGALVVTDEATFEFEVMEFSGRR